MTPIMCAKSNHFNISANILAKKDKIIIQYIINIYFISVRDDEKFSVPTHLIKSDQISEYVLYLFWIEPKTIQLPL